MTPLTARHGDVSLWAEVAGEPDAPTLVLIMGLGMQSVAWDDGFVAALVARGLRVIRFDHRDIGLSSSMRSPTPPLPTAVLSAWFGRPVAAPYTLADMAADVLALADAAGAERFHVAGVSMGAMIAQVLAITRPERVASLTSMMSTTGIRWLPPPRPSALAALLSSPSDEATREDWAVGVFRRLHGDGSPFDEAWARDRVRRFASRSPDRSGVPRHLAAVLAAPDRTEALRQVRCPAAVLHGSHDPLLRPAAGARTARALGVPLQVVDGMGHAIVPAFWPTLVAAIADTAARGEAAAR